MEDHQDKIYPLHMTACELLDQPLLELIRMEEESLTEEERQKRDEIRREMEQWNDSFNRIPRAVRKEMERARRRERLEAVVSQHALNTAFAKADQNRARTIANLKSLGAFAIRSFGETLIFDLPSLKKKR